MSHYQRLLRQHERPTIKRIVAPNRCTRLSKEDILQIKAFDALHMMTVIL